MYVWKNTRNGLSKNKQKKNEKKKVKEEKEKVEEETPHISIRQLIANHTLSFAQCGACICGQQIAQLEAHLQEGNFFSSPSRASFGLLSSHGLLTLPLPSLMVRSLVIVMPGVVL